MSYQSESGTAAAFTCFLSCLHAICETCWVRFEVIWDICIFQGDLYSREYGTYYKQLLVEKASEETNLSQNEYLQIAWSVLGSSD